jgi:hypothetical protein
VTSNEDGTELLPYHGPPLTVGNELNKLAANVATGRNSLGIHYRSEYWESVKLGEEVAIGILQEQKNTYNDQATIALPPEAESRKNPPLRTVFNLKMELTINGQSGHPCATWVIVTRAVLPQGRSLRLKGGSGR